MVVEPEPGARCEVGTSSHPVLGGLTYGTPVTAFTGDPSNSRFLSMDGLGKTVWVGIDAVAGRMSGDRDTVFTTVTCDCVACGRDCG